MALRDTNSDVKKNGTDTCSLILFTRIISCYTLVNMYFHAESFDEIKKDNSECDFQSAFESYYK